ncbi:hypothetical protein GE061_008476 [Apolygus lucorum]|uniref:Uncharacterized protein n=1 Tax=Apolygus lucorum TaxID=248454 RepID=A0A8S9WJP8_APOLU|nr:hypothetical protein GE061_008476 [Apolygus lucorum]
MDDARDMITSLWSAIIAAGGCQTFSFLMVVPQTRELRRDSIRLRSRLQTQGERLSDTERIDLTQAKTKYRRAGNSLEVPPPKSYADQLAKEHDHECDRAKRAGEIRRADRKAIFEFAADAITNGSLVALVGAVGITAKVSPILISGIGHLQTAQVGPINLQAEAELLREKIEKYVLVLTSVGDFLEKPDLSKQLNIPPGRHARSISLILGIGRIFSVLFDVASEGEVQELQDRLEELETDSGILHHGKEQLYIISKMEEQIQNNTSALKQIIMSLISTHEEIHQVLNLLSSEFKQVWKHLAWEESMRKCESELASARQQLTQLQLGPEAASKGLLSPSVLDYRTLRVALIQVQSMLQESGRNLPFPPEDKFLYAYYQQVHVKAVASQDDLAFIITIPVTDSSTTFILFRVHSMPVLDTRVSHWMQWAGLEPYLGISEDQQHFISLTDSQFLQCSHLTPRICPVNILYVASRLPHAPKAFTTDSMRDVNTNFYPTSQDQKSSKLDATGSIQRINP